MTQLTISNLSSQYDDKAVITELSLTLEQDDIVALLGPSGCGKTTLLRAIAGLQPITSGEIKLGDVVMTTPSQSVASEKRNIGMIFQDYALFPHLNVTDNVAFGLQKLTKSQRFDVVEEMLRLVKLQGYGDRFPHELSGGQQQRVAIARALAYKPQLMLLDEPFSNIDSQSRGEIMQEMRQILKAQGVPAVFVTHSKDEAFAFADKIAIFSEGKIEQIDKGSVLYAEPSSPYVANFMGKTNYLTIDSVSDKGLETALGTIPMDADQLINSHNVVMLRPEQLVIDEHSSCRFSVVQSIFAGSHWIYKVKAIATDDVIVEVHSHAMLELEQVVGLTVLPHKSVTFNINK